MDSTLLACWAKLAPNGDVHPLVCHMIDVSSVAEVMWDDALPPSARRSFANAVGIGDLDVARVWVSFLAGLHDIGKASPAFQLQESSIEKDQKRRLKEAGLWCPRNPDKVPHGVITTIAVQEILHALFPTMTTEVANRIAQVLGGHHGLFPRSDEQMRTKGNMDAIGEESWEKLRKRLGEVLGEGLSVPRDFVPIKLDNAAAMQLAGFVSVADWIGSDERRFPYLGKRNTTVEAYSRQAKNQAHRALQELGWLAQPGASRDIPFAHLFPTIPPNPLQQAVIGLADHLRGPAIIIVEAPMGEGKTEAALYLAQRLGLERKQPGLYVAMPTQATSDQMFSRVLPFLQRSFIEPGASTPLNVRLLHGHAALSAEMDRLTEEAEKLVDSSYGGDHEEGEKHGHADLGLLAAEWFSYRKRGLLAPFGIGTVDQALMAVLQTRHVFVRLWGLSNKTVIIDEAHAYDTYMTTLLERLLEWLGALETSVVILSATLPPERRAALLAAYQKGLNAVHSDVPALLPSQPAPYPCLTWLSRAAAGARSIEVSARGRKELGFQWVDGVLPTSAGAPFALGEELRRALVHGGCAAIVCNTVRRAQEVYQALKPYFQGSADDGGPVLDLFHAQYLQGDRMERQNRALVRFGKEGESVSLQDGTTTKVRRPDRAVLVATQVIEQSLDLDFDLMVSDMAPVDLLLQRSGRLQRHARTRPAGLEKPTLWVCRPTEHAGVPVFEQGTVAVYDGHVLLRSWLALQQLEKAQGPWVRVPKDVEGLIEAVYGERTAPEALSNSLQTFWGNSFKKLDSTKKEYASRAKNNTILPPDYEDDILEDFIKGNTDLLEDSPDAHPTVQALTRLAERTVPVVCLLPEEVASLLISGSVGKERMKALLLHSLTISHQGAVRTILDSETTRPPAIWRQSPLLRHHRLLKLGTDGTLLLGKYVIALDTNFGLRVLKQADMVHYAAEEENNAQFQSF